MWCSALNFEVTQGGACDIQSYLNFMAFFTGSRSIKNVAASDIPHAAPPIKRPRIKYFGSLCRARG